MKRTSLSILAFLFSVILVASVQPAQAQVTQEGDITAGIGLSYGLDIEEAGLTIQGFYTITDQIRAGAGYTYYFMDNDVSAGELNIDGHYLFKNEDGLILYGLAGLSFARTSVKVMGSKFSSSDTGVNLGAGVEYDLGAVYLFGEPKFTLGGFEQLQVTAGVRLRF